MPSETARIDKQKKHIDCMSSKCKDKDTANYMDINHKIHNLTKKLTDSKLGNDDRIKVMEEMLKLAKSIKPTKKIIKCAAEKCIDTKYDVDMLRRDSDIARAESTLKEFKKSKK